MLKKIDLLRHYGTLPLFIDYFAGGGGASTGIEAATGHSPNIAVNHCPLALGMHAANHPKTLHLESDVWAVNIASYTHNQPVLALWASPDCTHFSRALGNKPKSKAIRGLAWVIIKFCKDLGDKRPSYIFLENVPEFKTWEDFVAWKQALIDLGYNPEFRVLRACDYGAPTIRDRLYMIAPRHGLKANWPQPTHGNPNSLEVQSGILKPWNTTADIIDWSIKCPSIFLDKKQARKYGVRRPLVDNTLKRIFIGIERFVLNADQPFIIPQENGLISVPFIDRTFSQSRGASILDPLGTITAGGGGHSALVSVSMQKYGRKGYSEEKNHEIPGLDLNAPIIASNIINLRGTSESHLSSCSNSIKTPMHTITSGGTHIAEVRTQLERFTGKFCPDNAVTLKINNERYAITDIGMRMLTVKELFRAQGFPETYQIDLTIDGHTLTKTDQIEKCGNSVCPPVAEAIIKANIPISAYSRALAA